ncbi:MAG TPA: long-chain fatty acid--CoA ligase [Thermoleophilaceae bacterium]|nr:long-chain fatty acid--CoA ligase [Thermoleophilaceae bacterium]
MPVTLYGAMQEFPLTTAHILGRMQRIYADSEVVTLREPGESTRASYSEVAERAQRLSAALSELGVGDGDRVATYSWNTQEHLEAYMAVPTMGAVLHTLNIRLFEEQLVYVANHAEDKIVLVDASLVKPLSKVADQLETVEHFVVVGEGAEAELPNQLDYEELLAAQKPGYDYPELEENQAAALCYTSGTTGNPKGVLYSHRSTVLHAMGAGMAESIGASSADRILPIVPMFHANAWGLAHQAGLVGADLIMPGRFLQAEPLVKLIEEEQVTIAGGVPTVFMDVLRHADENDDVDLSTLRKVTCGGSAVPLSLMQAFEERHGVYIEQAWGMTEMSPLGTIARPPAGTDDEERKWDYRSSAGRVNPLVEARIVDDDGAEVDWDGEETGELEVRGPWIAASYYRDDSDDKFDDGWLRTGDIASIDPRGYVRITDRAKDVIKSGGEWISSVELENEIMGHPDVAEAAVIAIPDERWSERPLACIVPEEGKEVSAQSVREHLAERVAKWWLPDTYAVIDEVPKTSVGKFDKKVLRQRLEDGELDTEQAEEVKA